MPIRTIRIKRFKQLQDIEILPTETTLLIGANNSGKSSILQAIHFAVSIAQSSKIVGVDLPWAKGQFQLSFNPSQLIYSPIADVLALAGGGELLEAQNQRIEIEFLENDGSRCVVGLRRGRNRNIAVFIEGQQLGEKLMDFTNPFSVYAPGLAGIAREERFMSPGVVRRIVARGDANLVLRNVLYMLSSAEDQTPWSSFTQDMQRLFPGMLFKVNFDWTKDENIYAWFKPEGGPWLPFDAAGTSVLQACQIVAYISLFRPKILILDEPDSHLHPDNQRNLCSLIQRLTVERDFQAMISTHSRHVLDAMRGKGGLYWLSKGTLVPEQDRGTTAILLDLGALDSVDYFADGTLRCVVATEDTDTAPLEAVLWSNGFVMDDTEVRSYSGCSKIDSALVLGQFISEKAANTRLVVHRDGDYSTAQVEQKFRNRLEPRGVLPFITEHSDIEGYFLNASHLHELNPGISRDKIQEIILRIVIETREDSIKAIVNLRTAQAFQERQKTGQNVDHGSIAVQAASDFDSNPSRFCRGDKVIGKVAAAIQQEIGAHARVFEPSPHLASPRLAAIALAIWQAPPVAPPVAPPASA